jgi:hypothetical protein
MLEETSPASINMLPKTWRIMIVFGIALGVVNLMGILAHAFAGAAYAYWGYLFEPIADVVAAIIPAVDAISEPLKDTEFSDRIVLTRTLFSLDWILLIPFLVWGLRSAISEFSCDPDSFSRAVPREQITAINLIISVPFLVGLTVLVYNGHYLFPGVETIVYNDHYILIVAGVFWSLFVVATVVTVFCAIVLHQVRTRHSVFPDLKTISHDDRYLLLVSGLVWGLFVVAIAVTAVCAMFLYQAGAR